MARHEGVPADLESLIRAAYQELANGPQDWVRLAKLRPKLDGASGPKWTRSCSR